jgi:quinol monooxygenase YgiN
LKTPPDLEAVLIMFSVGLLVRLEAKPGKEADVEESLRSALPLVEAEPDTTAWFAFRCGTASFGIFGSFPDDAGRQAHLAGRVAETLRMRAADLLSGPPTVESVDAVAWILPTDAIPPTSMPGFFQGV